MSYQDGKNVSPKSDGSSIISEDNLRLEDKSDNVNEGVNNHDRVQLA